MSVNRIQPKKTMKSTTSKKKKKKNVVQKVANVVSKTADVIENSARLYGIIHPTPIAATIGKVADSVGDIASAIEGIASINGNDLSWYNGLPANGFSLNFARPVPSGQVNIIHQAFNLLTNPRNSDAGATNLLYPKSVDYAANLLLSQIREELRSNISYNADDIKMYLQAVATLDAHMSFLTGMYRRSKFVDPNSPVMSNMMRGLPIVSGAYTANYYNFWTGSNTNWSDSDELASAREALYRISEQLKLVHVPRALHEKNVWLFQTAFADTKYKKNQIYVNDLDILQFFTLSSDGDISWPTEAQGMYSTISSRGDNYGTLTGATFIEKLINETNAILSNNIFATINADIKHIKQSSNYANIGLDYQYLLDKPMAVVYDEEFFQAITNANLDCEGVLATSPIFNAAVPVGNVPVDLLSSEVDARNIASAMQFMMNNTTAPAGTLNEDSPYIALVLQVATASTGLAANYSDVPTTNNAVIVSPAAPSSLLAGNEHLLVGLFSQVDYVVPGIIEDAAGETYLAYKQVRNRTFVNYDQVNSIVYYIDLALREAI